MDKTSKYNLRKRNKKTNYKTNEESDDSDRGGPRLAGGSSFRLVGVIPS